MHQIEADSAARVLVIEDEPRLAADLVSLLAPVATVALYSDARDAGSDLRARPVDALVADVAAPSRVHGHVLQRLHADRHHLVSVDSSERAADGLVDRLQQAAEAIDARRSGETRIIVVAVNAGWITRTA